MCTSLVSILSPADYVFLLIFVTAKNKNTHCTYIFLYYTKYGLIFRVRILWSVCVLKIVSAYIYIYYSNNKQRFFRIIS